MRCKNMQVFVTDASKRESVAIVRSLGKKGIEVTVGEDRRICCSFFSKYVKNRTIYPNPVRNPLSFVQRIYELVKKDKYDVIFPVNDPTTILFSKYKEKLSKYTKVPVANYETIMKGRDKAQTMKIAMENDVPCPQTYFVDNGDIEKIKNRIEFPVVIKPCKSSGARGVVYVNSSPEEFVREYKRVRNQYGPVLVQEYIPGEHYNVSALFNVDTELRAAFVLKKIRQYPVSGGPTTFAVSVEKPDVLKCAVKLLKAMNWYGVAEVELIVDERDKKPKLLEVNPRFWSPLELSILSGIDFPYLLYKMATEGDVEPVTKYKTGVKLRFLVGDILWFLSTPNKLKALPEFIKFRDDNLGYAILSLDDPKPMIGFLFDNLISLMRKEGRKHVLRGI